MFFSARRIHFTGIGGIGMSGLAELLLARGVSVSGSDLQASSATERLSALGARVFTGHDPAHIAGAELVVVTSAAREDNPEISEARRRGVPVVKRGELLAELMRPCYGIAIAGSHGKTTTTAMTASILEAAALDPTAVVGGRMAAWGGSNVRCGAGPYFVAESDESDGSFLLLSPIVCVITNIDREHLDHYGDFQELRRAFARFAGKPPFYGRTVLCAEDPEAAALRERLQVPVWTYGFRHGCDLQLAGLSVSAGTLRFTLRFQGKDEGEFSLPVMGEHNALNAAAACAVAFHLGIPAETVRRALSEFRGVGRRMQIIGTVRGITVADDYGHHPAEILATLAAARQAGYRRILVLFQPHRYSRTRNLLEEFGACFQNAAKVCVLDVYSANEAPIPGVSGEEVARRIRAASCDAEYCCSVEEAIARLTEEAREGDLILTLGAGDVYKAAPQAVAKLEGGG